MPHFHVTDLDGRDVKYSELWQRRNLVLVELPSSDDAGDGAAYARQFAMHAGEIAGHDGECVVTRDAVPGLPAPAALVADRWGEIVYAVTSSAVADLPAPGELLEWLEHVHHRCPECEGEAR